MDSAGRCWTYRIVGSRRTAVVEPCGPRPRPAVGADLAPRAGMAERRGWKPARAGVPHGVRALVRTHELVVAVTGLWVDVGRLTTTLRGVATKRATGNITLLLGRAGYVAMAMFTLTMLAGCSTGPLPAARPDSVRVERVQLPPSPLRQSSASTVLLATSPARLLYSLINSLPPWPKPAPVCPADHGTNYRLTFIRHGQTLVRVVADPNGCPNVTGRIFGRSIMLYAANGTGEELFRLLKQSHK